MATTCRSRLVVATAAARSSRSGRRSSRAAIAIRTASSIVSAWATIHELASASPPIALRIMASTPSWFMAASIDVAADTSLTARHGRLRHVSAARHDGHPAWVPASEPGRTGSPSQARSRRDHEHRLDNLTSRHAIRRPAPCPVLVATVVALDARRPRVPAWPATSPMPSPAASTRWLRRCSAGSSRERGIGAAQWMLLRHRGGQRALGRGHGRRVSASDWPSVPPSVGYRTDTASLVVMGAISGAAVGAAQGARPDATPTGCCSGPRHRRPVGGRLVRSPPQATSTPTPAWSCSAPRGLRSALSRLLQPCDDRPAPFIPEAERRARVMCRTRPPFVVRRRRAVIVVWARCSSPPAPSAARRSRCCRPTSAPAPAPSPAGSPHTSTTSPRPAARSPSSPTASTSTTRRSQHALTAGLQRDRRHRRRPRRRRPLVDRLRRPARHRRPRRARCRHPRRRSRRRRRARPRPRDRGPRPRPRRAEVLVGGNVLVGETVRHRLGARPPARRGDRPAHRHPRHGLPARRTRRRRHAAARRHRRRDHHARRPRRRHLARRRVDLLHQRREHARHRPGHRLRPADGQPLPRGARPWPRRPRRRRATVASAGTTVVFSALTVAVAMSGLFVFGVPLLTSFGIAGLSVVLLSMAAAVTLLPATLAAVGGRIRPTAPVPDIDGRFYRLTRWVQGHAVAVGAAPWLCCSCSACRSSAPASRTATPARCPAPPRSAPRRPHPRRAVPGPRHRSGHRDRRRRRRQRRVRGLVRRSSRPAGVVGASIRPGTPPGSPSSISSPAGTSQGRRRISARRPDPSDATELRHRGRRHRRRAHRRQGQAQRPPAAGRRCWSSRPRLCCCSS